MRIESVRGCGPVVPTSTSEAHACWQWMAYVQGQIPEGKRPLLMNLDETRVTWYFGGGKGNVLVSRRHGRRPAPVQRATKTQLRSGLTHAALICDRPDVQAVLPQVFFHNEHFPTLRSLRATASEHPPNVVFIRQKSSWTNVSNLCDILRRVAASVAPWKSEFQPVLLLDCARQHVHWRVAAAAVRGGIWLVFVPAKLTWLLQPCDTHVFAAYKAFAQARYGEILAAAPSQEVSQEDWLRLLGHIVRVFLQGRVWHSAFLQNGFGAQGQGGVRQEILAELGGELLPASSAERPSADHLRTLFPGGWNVPAKHFWKPFDVPPSHVAPLGGAAGSSLGPPPPLPAPPEPPPDLAEVEGSSVWSGRLRAAPKPSCRAMAMTGAPRAVRRRLVALPEATPLPPCAPGRAPPLPAPASSDLQSRAPTPKRSSRRSAPSSSVATPRAASRGAGL
jgi:hypothetical protein